MGADIHIMLERKVDGRWETWERFAGIPRRAIEQEAKLPQGHDMYYRFTYRNYAFFAALAGVRGPGPEPRGIPEDISAVAKAYIESWDGDGHSHTWLFAEEFCKAFMQHHMTEKEIAEFSAAKLEGSIFAGWEHIMNYYICNLGTTDRPTDYRFIIFFDN